MEIILSEKDNRAGFSPECCFIEKMLWWLEKEDTDTDKLVGYGICLAATTYFLSRVLQLLF